MTSCRPGFLYFILHNNVSKRIIIYLLYLLHPTLSLNFAFMFVELIYGVISNSLGLISDAVHMFFDCSALVLTLVAAYFSSLPANQRFPFGFVRVEVVSGFVNCVFLVFVAASIVFESVERLISPQQVAGDLLIAISVLGLFVNVVGIFLLAETHTEQTDPKSNGKRYDGLECEKSEGKNENLAGLFLHVISDALGSVGVIISSMCIKYYGMVMADPICSLGISALIVGSIVSLLASTVSTLSLKLPKSLERKRERMVARIEDIESVKICKKLKIWALKQNELMVTANIVCDSSCNKGKAASRVRAIMKDFRIRKFTLELA